MADFFSMMMCIPIASATIIPWLVNSLMHLLMPNTIGKTEVTWEASFPTGYKTPRWVMLWRWSAWGSSPLLLSSNGIGCLDDGVEWHVTIDSTVCNNIVSSELVDSVDLWLIVEVEYWGWVDNVEWVGVWSEVWVDSVVFSVQVLHVISFCL